MVVVVVVLVSVLPGGEGGGGVSGYHRCGGEEEEEEGQQGILDVEVPEVQEAELEEEKGCSSSPLPLQIPRRSRKRIPSLKNGWKFDRDDGV